MGVGEVYFGSGDLKSKSKQPNHPRQKPARSLPTQLLLPIQQAVLIAKGKKQNLPIRSLHVQKHRIRKRPF